MTWLADPGRSFPLALLDRETKADGLGLASKEPLGEASQAGTIRIGISGWRYAGWRGHFYPKGLAQRRELGFAAKTFSSVAINGTFYSLQRPSSFQRWASETPSDFVFAVKGGRFITHMKKLVGVRRRWRTSLRQVF